LTLYTTISPTCVFCPLFHKNSKSPLSNAGSMDPDSTTTMGDGESETTERPFQSMKAVDRTSAKLRTCAANCRGCMAERPSMVAVVVVMFEWRLWVVEVEIGRFCEVRKICGGIGGREKVDEVCAPWQSPQVFEVMCRGASVVSYDARCPSIRRTDGLRNPRAQLRNDTTSTPPSAYHRTRCLRSYLRVYRKLVCYWGGRNGIDS
jgi:hypothetical protein